MHSINNPADELTVSFGLAYDATLRPHHSFIVRPIFNVSTYLDKKMITSGDLIVLLLITLVGYECLSLEKRLL